MNKTAIARINDFIKRRFPIDCNWMDGNCYWFAQILANAFPEYEPIICYWPKEGHFTCCFWKLNKAHFDYSGEVTELDNFFSLDAIAELDPEWYQRLRRDCII